jgi:hypothetical protein
MEALEVSMLMILQGNEIINDVSTAQDNPPYIRAIQRDLKNYISKHADRTIPVGYSAADVAEVLDDTWAYLQCNNSNNNDPNSRSDFFGLNSYSWCGNASSYTISGYNVLVETFGTTSIPVFFRYVPSSRALEAIADDTQANMAATTQYPATSTKSRPFTGRK